MAKRRNKGKPNATGRNETSRFARLDHSILHSNAYRALSPNARSLLVELASMENDSNNGSLFLSVQDGAHRMGVADLTAASRAFAELQDLGFIQMTQNAHFSVKAANTSRARCWRLTWRPGPGRRGPSWDFLEREPEPKTAARKRMDRGLRALKAHRKAHGQNKYPVLDSNTMTHFCPQDELEAVLDSYTADDENDGFQPKSIVMDSAIHTAVTMGEGARQGLIGWWQPDWTPLAASAAFAAHLAHASRSSASTMRTEHGEKDKARSRRRAGGSRRNR